MILPVFQQGGLFLGMIAAGLALAFFYDIFRVTRRIVPHSAVFIHIEDFLYWLVVIAVVFGFLLVLNNGGLRLYSIAGVFAGMLIYYMFISPVFLKFSMTIYGYLKTAVLFIFSVFAAPFIAFARVMRPPARIAARKAEELYKYEKRIYTGVKIRGKHSAKKIRNNINIILKKS